MIHAIMPDRNTGDSAKTKRPRIERIRGPNLAVFVKNSTGVPMDEAIRRADDAGLTVASNKRLDRALRGNAWNPTLDPLDDFPSHSGTNTAYVRMDIPFGKAAVVIDDLEQAVGTRYFVGYTDSDSGKRWLFPVHPDDLGLENHILVIEHPNYALHLDGNDIITLPLGAGLKEAVDKVPFPTSEGWYLPDPVHGIPSGDIIPYRSPDIRYLHRSDNRVGLVSRCAFGSKGVNLVRQPSLGLAMIVESP